MSTFVVYDPNGVHQQSNVDLDIKVFITQHALVQSLTTNIDLRRVVCLYGNDKSNVIHVIQDYPQVVSIYVCKLHAEREQDPLYGPKVRTDFTFTSTSDWEFHCRLDLLKNCKRQTGCNGQALYELEKLIQIVSHRLSHPQQQNVQDEYSGSSDAA